MLRLTIIIVLLAFPVWAQNLDPLEEYLWKVRPLVIFATSPNDPALLQQLEFIEDRREELELRDVVVLVDTDPREVSDLRRKLRPVGFQLVLLGKDGRVVLRKPRPWDVRELMRVIDKIPLRKQEIEAQKAMPTL